MYVLFVKVARKITKNQKIDGKKSSSSEFNFVFDLLRTGLDQR